MKTVVVEEGSNIILKYVYEFKFVGIKLWYKRNKTIKFDEPVPLKVDTIISINNLNLNNANMYGCVSPNNEFVKFSC